MSTAKVLFPNDEEIYKIIKGLPNAEKLQDKIWESFCLENEAIQSKNKSPKQRRFKKHPNNFDRNENKMEDDKDIEKHEDDCDSIDSDFMDEALFGINRFKDKIKNQSGTYHKPQEYLKNDNEYDSLEEFCDVTFRNVHSVTHKSYKTSSTNEDVQNKCPRVSNKKVIPSINKPPVKMMSPIKPIKKPFTIAENIRAGGDDKVPEIEMDTVPVEYDMNKDRRLKAVLQKCNNAMDDIRLLIDIGIPQPDGEEDYLRRKKRAVEFSNRFSRNYLYQLNRLTNDIRKLLRPYATQKVLRSSPTTTTTTSNAPLRSINTMTTDTAVNHLAITQKFIIALQLVAQSLMAYHSHLPTSIIVGAPHKLKDLLGLCVTLCQLQGVLLLGDGEGAENIFNSFSTRSKSLLERINECCQIDSTNTSLLKSDRSKLSLLGYNVTKGKGDASSKMQLAANNSRFSMYGDKGGCRKDAYWRNAIATLGKKHFNVNSRYKTAKFKHRPAVDRMPHSVNQQNQPPFQAFPINNRPSASNNQKEFTSNSNFGGRILLDRKQSEMSLNDRASVIRRARPSRYSLNDDDISTVMQNVMEEHQFPDESGKNVKCVNAGRPDVSENEEEEVDSHSHSSGDALRPKRRSQRLQKEKHHINKCYHSHNTKIPQAPMSSPQGTSNVHLDAELIGESSQCDLAPPTIKTSNTTNTIIPTKESQCSIKNCCNCNCNNKVTEAVDDRRNDRVTVDLKPCLECHECQKQLNDASDSSEVKQTKAMQGADDYDGNWSKLSTDCDRTMKRLDERTVRRGNDRGARQNGGVLLGQDGEVLNCLLEHEEEDNVVVGDKDKDLGRKKSAKILVAEKSALTSEGTGGLEKKKNGGGGDKRREKVTITSVTGAKNAKLICIRDDNSLTLDTTTSDIVEDHQKSSNNNIKKPSTKHNTRSNQLQYVHSETQTDVPQSKQLIDSIDSHLNGNNGQKRKNVKISRLPKAKVKRQLQMLDKNTSLNVIRYKLDYHRARKENPMYKKTVSGVQPWSLMEKVSDGILDHLLLSVAREIQVDDILVKLYESEFYAA